MKDNRLPYGLLLAAVIASVLMGAAWLMQSHAQEERAAPASVAAAESSGTVAANPFARGENLPPIASDTQAAAGTRAFRIDGAGNLVLQADTRIRLDMLIAGLPRNATRHELQELAASAITGLPQHAAQQASRILDGYVRYARAEADLNAELAAQGTIVPEEVLDKMIALRRQHLGGQAADALFAAQEAQERVGVRVAMIEADPKLTVQEKLARIDALQSALPAGAADLASDLESSRSALMMEQDVAALRLQGAPDTQVRQLRERHVGAEAANRIAEMEVQKTDWERRQQEFLERKNLIARMGLSEQQKQERVEALLSQLYTEEEIPAARAYHQLQGHNPLQQRR